MSTPVAGSLDAVHALAPGLAPTICRAARRVLAVAALAVTGLLVFVLLPGRNVPAVTSGPYLLPPVPTVDSWHPRGPNRPVKPADPAGPAKHGDPRAAVTAAER